VVRFWGLCFFGEAFWWVSWRLLSEVGCCFVAYMRVAVSLMIFPAFLWCADFLFEGNLPHFTSGGTVHVVVE
jgi:hypothetical protein